MTAGRDLSWLQDTSLEAVWSRWQVVYRDVRILDSENRLRAVFNLTAHNLGFESERVGLKELLREAARVTDADLDGLPDDWEKLSHLGLAARPGGDPDGDRRDNFVELAFGTDPTTSDTGGRLRFAEVVRADQRFFAVKVRRRAGAFLEYVLERSADLSEWSAVPADGMIRQTPRNFFDGTGTWEETYLLDSTETPHAWFRLRVEGRN